MNKIIKEACVTSLADALQAQRNGADQIELCSRLDLDGLTPSEELIRSVLTKIDIPVKVLIRPRAGDFIYNDEELITMEKQIEFCKKVGVSGIVTGVMNMDKQLNFKQLASLIKLANPLPVYVHKAIDVTQNPLAAIELLRQKAPAIAGVLTSGGAATAEEGLPVLKQMMEYDTDDFQIVVAGEVTPQNLTYLHTKLNGRYYHGRNIVNTKN